MSGLVILDVSTGDTFYATAASASYPIVLLLYFVSIFAQPSRQDRKTMLFLRAHFISFALVGEGAHVINAIRKDDVGLTVIGLSLTLLDILTFHCGLKLRASIGRLPDKDLNEVRSGDEGSDERNDELRGRVSKRCRRPSPELSFVTSLLPNPPQFLTS